MGCDIHGVVQVRWRDSSGWMSADEIDRDRNYTLFAALAGVRNDEEVEPISEPRGLPEDFKMSGDEHQLDSDRMVWMGDHSHSWLTLDEIEAWPGWDKDNLRADVGNQWWAWLRWIRLKWSMGPADVRIVFGFDN